MLNIVVVIILTLKLQNTMEEKNLLDAVSGVENANEAANAANVVPENASAVPDDTAPVDAGTNEQTEEIPDVQEITTTVVGGRKGFENSLILKFKDQLITVVKENDENVLAVRDSIQFPMKSLVKMLTEADDRFSLFLSSSMERGMKITDLLFLLKGAKMSFRSEFVPEGTVVEANDIEYIYSKAGIRRELVSIEWPKLVEKQLDMFEERAVSNLFDRILG